MVSTMPSEVEKRNSKGGDTIFYHSRHYSEKWLLLEVRRQWFILQFKKLGGRFWRPLF